jgi:hypothetical protein
MKNSAQLSRNDRQLHDNGTQLQNNDANQLSTIGKKAL